MRLPLISESGSRPILSYSHFPAFSRWARAIAIAGVVLIGFGVTTSRAAADPIPEEELDVIFAWVVNQEAAEVAFEGTASLSSTEIQMSVREYLLLRIWANGGDPWALDPTWEAPTGP